MAYAATRLKPVTGAFSNLPTKDLNRQAFQNIEKPRPYSKEWGFSRFHNF